MFNVDGATKLEFKDFSITKPKDQMSKIEYSAPEVYLELGITKKTDVWSLGRILVDWLTDGRFKADSNSQSLK